MSERERRPRERPHSQNYARSNGARKREMGVQTSSIVFRPADSAATKGMADAAAGHSDCTALRKPAYIIGFSPAAATGSVALDFSFAPLPSAADRPSPPPRAPHPHLSFALPAPSPSLSPSLNNSGKLFLQLVDLLLPDEETEGEGRGEQRG